MSVCYKWKQKTDIVFLRLDSISGKFQHVISFQFFWTTRVLGPLFGPLLVPFSLKIRSPFGPLSEYFGSTFKLGTVIMALKGNYKTGGGCPIAHGNNLQMFTVMIKTFPPQKKVFNQVPPSKAPNLVSEYDVMPHELPTFLFIEVTVRWHYTRQKATLLTRLYKMFSIRTQIYLGNFFQDKNEKDKLATGLSYQQLNGSGVTTEKLGEQISIVFRI